VACELLGVSTSGFYAWASRAPSDRALSDAWLVEKIKTIHVENRGVYGSRRVQAELRLGEGIRVSRKRVQRLMRRAGLSGLVSRKRGRTTIRVPGVRVADDLVERRFRPAAPDVLWVADITYLRTWEGWVYLAAIQDAFSRRIVGWSMADHMRAELVLDALQMALHRRNPGPGLVHHSDQGSQFVSLAFGQKARDAGIAVSMGSKGCAYDNAVAESSSPRSRRSSCIAAHGQHAVSSSARSSSSSKASTTPPADTRPSATSHPPSSRPSTSQPSTRRTASSASPPVSEEPGPPQ
jgi:putative transposase